MSTPSLTITFKHLADTRSRLGLVHALPDMLSALDMACYPYHQAALKGEVRRRALFRLSLTLNGETIPREILEQQREYCPEVSPDMQLLRYNASRHSLDYGYDSPQEAIEELIREGEATGPADFTLLKAHYALEILPLPPG